ncbi:hypothetical protein B0H12DRAFT_1135983 [Mycena haematopus]|nr:hypothetical protein B0H12DRAFT_1135983 [Mycena haematopus]
MEEGYCVKCVCGDAENLRLEMKNILGGEGKVAWMSKKNKRNRTKRDEKAERDERKREENRQYEVKSREAQMSKRPLLAHGCVPIHGPHTPTLAAAPTLPFAQRNHLWPSTPLPPPTFAVPPARISSNPLFTTFASSPSPAAAPPSSASTRAARNSAAPDRQR